MVHHYGTGSVRVGASSVSAPARVVFVRSSQKLIKQKKFRIWVGSGSRYKIVETDPDPAKDTDPTLQHCLSANETSPPLKLLGFIWSFLFPRRKITFSLGKHLPKMGRGGEEARLPASRWRCRRSWCCKFCCSTPSAQYTLVQISGLHMINICHMIIPVYQYKYITYQTGMWATSGTYLMRKNWSLVSI